LSLTIQFRSSLSDNINFQADLCIAEDVFPSLSKAVNTFETVPPETSSIQEVSVTLAPAIQAPTIWPPQKSERLAIYRLGFRHQKLTKIHVQGRNKNCNIFIVENVLKNYNIRMSVVSLILSNPCI
jgi:hypothetical protein